MDHGFFLSLQYEAVSVIMKLYMAKEEMKKIKLFILLWFVCLSFVLNGMILSQDLVQLDFILDFFPVL